MVDRIDWQEANRLYEERRNIEMALFNLSHGGTITWMAISPNNPDAATPELLPSTMVANIDTSYIHYPPQMVDAIRAAITNRRVEINNRLREIGLTGVY